MLNPLQLTLVVALRLYRIVLSPAKIFLFGPAGHCRFTPTCSAYALEAVGAHGAVQGSWLSLRRLGRCHPWGGCGHDPVPPLRADRDGRPSATHPFPNRDAVEASHRSRSAGWTLPALGAAASSPPEATADFAR
jgi:putative membrane protein insertion efficiency factor